MKDFIHLAVNVSFRIYAWPGQLAPPLMGAAQSAQGQANPFIGRRAMHGTNSPANLP